MPTAKMPSARPASLWMLEPATPNFLPRYYEEALTLGGKPLRLITKGETTGIERASYASPDGTVRLAVERTGCDRANCDALYEKHLREYNAKLGSHRGRFSTVSLTEFAAEWKTGSKWSRVLVAKLPRAVIVWVREVPATRRLDDEQFLGRVMAATNQQRYREAMAVDNVEVGRWATSIHQHARDLLARGNTQEAVAVLKQVIIWSPYSFEAQLDLAENSKDAAAVRASAIAVWENAESFGLTVRAARLLGRTEPDWESLPSLVFGARGLQVVLIALPPCNIRLVEQAGNVLSRIIDVPVRIVRLPDEWRWGKPDRVFRQRDIQSLILQRAGKPVDFTGWLQDRYTKELGAAVAKDDALTKFRIESFLQDSASKPGQYLADPYVSKLLDIVRSWTNNDRRTLFVGVTETDIYSGQANFYFSRGIRAPDTSVSILSYARMQATMASEPYESRKRLIERLAKEMVPASLNQLEIPRPVDPADPYSYADSVERLAQKTLALTAPTREALDRLRGP